MSGELLMRASVAASYLCAAEGKETVAVLVAVSSCALVSPRPLNASAVRCAVVGKK